MLHDLARHRGVHLGDLARFTFDRVTQNEWRNPGFARGGRCRVKRGLRRGDD